MKKIEERVVFQGKWLSLKETVYINNFGEKVVWESVERSENTNVVSVLARMKPSGRIILIKQFRQSVNNFVIGFPAGLYKDDPAEQALKELKEETGYTGTIVSLSPVLKTNSGMADTNIVVAEVEVDEIIPENKNPVQSLEPAEEIEVVLLYPSEIKNYLIRETEKGVCIGPGIWYFAAFYSFFN